MSSRLNVLRCTAGRSCGQHPASLRALYCTYTQSTALYRASSWMSALSDNNLMKLDVQHRAGARIITGCTKSTPVSALMRESDLLPLADQANIARLREKALRRRQDTPIAKAARRSEEIARREDPGRRSRNQVQRLSTKSSWRDTAQEIARRAGVDRSQVEFTALGPPPWLDLASIHFWLEVEDHQLNMALPAARLLAATRTLAACPPSSRHPPVDRWFAVGKWRWRGWLRHLCARYFACG